MPCFVWNSMFSKAPDSSTRPVNIPAVTIAPGRNGLYRCIRSFQSLVGWRTAQAPHFSAFAGCACASAAAYPSGLLFSMMLGPRRCTEGGGAAERRLMAGSGKMRPYRILEHTADIGFEAFGSTREETFANAARALTDLIVDLDAIDPREELTVRVQGADPESLLVNWLSELLYLHDAEGWLFRDFEIQNLRDDSLVAVARGEKFERWRHEAKLQVKAITYHQLALERTPEGWRAQVYVDI